jgi:YhcH/YjgK/YiaL family protein
MTYASEESLTPSDAYDAAKDVIHFDNSDPGARFLIRDGGYMIFKPGEVHKSKGLVGKSEPIKKIVVKIKEV